MSLKLRIQKTLLKRKINDVMTPGYYGRVITNGKIAFDAVARESAKNTTLHDAEAELAARLLLDGICARIKEGYIVDLGPLGTLYPAVNGTWKTNPDDLALSEMTPKVQYRPSDDIAGAVRSASLGWALTTDDDDNASPTPSDDEGGDDDDNGTVNIEG